MAGLSPRVRGKRAGVPVAIARQGSIPACAGEALPQLRPDGGRGVYPRVCGGSNSFAQGAAVSEGLSPRVRGKPTSAQCHSRLTRSIPACAGEAPSPGTRGWQEGVYPRVCGGSWGRPLGRSCDGGLSPRVRGKRHQRHTAGDKHRSIPACAGEADRQCGRGRHEKVYPRVCGGSPFWVIVVSGVGDTVDGSLAVLYQIGAVRINYLFGRFAQGA